jgi:hypothetical protein
MLTIVLIFGVYCIAAGFLGFAMPRRLIAMITGVSPRTLYFGAVAGRLVLGTCLIAASDQSRFPATLYWFGVVMIVAAVLILAAGPSRLVALVRWWANRSEMVMRIWCIVAVGIGVFFCYASVG